MNRYRILSFFLLSILSSTSLLAQNKSFSLEEAEAQFLKNNLLMLAGQYNIDASKALTIQSRAYPNPVFTADFNLLDPDNNKIFNVGSQGQKAFGLEQMILLGGKRKSQIEIAKKNVGLAESELADLLRNLKFQLHTNFYDLYRQTAVIEGYNNQLQLLDSLIYFYNQQATKGNVAVKEVVRLRSVYMRVSSDRSQFSQSKIETMKTLQILLKENNELVPAVNQNWFNELLVKSIPSDLETIAKANRPDLQSAKQSAEIADLNIRLQKQLAIPDLVLNTNYDQRGGAFVNQVNIGFGIPLPVWNRSKGNIQAASAYLQQQTTMQAQKELEISFEVKAAIADLQRGTEEMEKAKKLYNNDFDVVFQGINDNFKKRNISILEFVDFFEAYNESKTDYERIRAELAIAAAKVNYVTASRIY